LKMAYSSGLLIWIISLLLMTYPVLCFFKGSRHTRKMMLPSATAVGVGVLSLWHYGSLLRSTNIFLFYAMFAIAIQNKIRRSGFKTSPRPQSPCWTETFNPRNIPDIPAVGRPSPS